MMQKLKHPWYLSLLTGFFLLLLAACHDVEIPEPPGQTAHAYGSEVFVRWNDVFLNVDQHAKGYRPGPGPRSLGYMGLAAYEATVAGIPENQSLKIYYSGLNIPDAEADAAYHWPTCVNETYYYLMRRFFFHMENDPSGVFPEIDLVHDQLSAEYAAQTTPEAYARSVAYGIAVAKAVYEWSETDAAGHDAFLEPQPAAYLPPSGPGRWQPTWPDYSRAMFPYWGQVRTFALRSQDKLGRQPVPYSEDSTSVFYGQAMEVFNTVNLIRNPQTQAEIAYAYDQYWMGIFWSDDILNLTFSPPSRLIAVANQVVAKERIDLAEAAELYAKMGLALNDCGVAVWNTKYHYNVERPVSYIRRVVSRQHPEAANWKTMLVNTNNNTEGITPAFPAYPSGHSGFGGAGAKILSAFFEYTPERPGTYHFTDYCHQYRNEFIGTPRSFASFDDLAHEDAISRIPLGVHFRMDCDEGLRMGKLAAQRVLELPWKK